MARSVRAGDGEEKSPRSRVERTVAIRKMTLDDVPAVGVLEASSFTRPWTADSFAYLLSRDGCEVWVLDDAEAGVVGYAVLWCVQDQGELANFAVAPALRRSGLGARLLERMLEVARERGVERVYLEVRVSNEAAIRLYRSFGFTEVGRRRQYYDKPVEDALLMAADL